MREARNRIPVLLAAVGLLVTASGASALDLVTTASLLTAPPPNGQLVGTTVPEPAPALLLALAALAATRRRSVRRGDNRA
jgi:MYXO-CTERM domain-containing protein